MHLYDIIIIEGKTEKEVDLRRMVFIAVLVILLMVNLVDVGIACKDYLAAHRKIEKAFLLISGAFGRTVILTMVGLAVYAVKLMD